jgi:Family of unknown function (DUF6152)
VAVATGGSIFKGACVKRIILTVLALLCAPSAGAHHSFAVFFDTQDKLVSVTGIVSDFQFRNPHGIITLNVPAAKGTIIWRAETNSPSILRRRGWTAESLHPGDKVTLEGWPAKDGTNYIRLRTAKFADGRVIGQPLG